MQVIHKYPVLAKPGESADIEIPIGAKIVHCALQNSGPVLWVLIGPIRNITKKRKFAVVGTGWDLPDDAEHIFTFMVGEFVWHVIEKKTADAVTVA